ncbi:DUF6884 domain-containing protein [Symbiobacterium terraclitae]|uniref:DUF6884 domain-containing protein n=1 Tax=Symbiobacterium terraclitae TaxID=557451 RepID=UPI003CC9E3C6
MSTSSRREWSERVLAQVRNRFGTSLAGLIFELHTGLEYREHLAELLVQAGVSCTCPVAGLQIGQHLRFYGTPREDT